MEKNSKNIEKFLTFYHEFRIPKNPFFQKREGSNSILFLSSPSRMGNHALISMLDSHPQLPKVPGEDSFLTWAFVKANYDIARFIDDVRDIDYVERMSSDSCLNNKWFEHKQLFDGERCSEIYNGVQYDYNKDSNGSLHRVPTQDSFVDFQGVLLDIHYNNYHNELFNNREIIKNATNIGEVFDVYLRAHHYLLNTKNKKFSMDYSYACSGMRVQALWALRNNKNVKMIVSIRRFESYAISMIKSFYKTTELREEYVREAWEQWYHKVVDYLYLKLNYPDQVLLLDFDDIINEPESVSNHICEFLAIDFNKSMLRATINGVSVKGNSSESREGKESGIFYKSVSKELPLELIPYGYLEIWKIFNNLKYFEMSYNKDVT